MNNIDVTSMKQVAAFHHGAGVLLEPVLQGWDSQQWASTTQEDWSFAYQLY